MKKFTLPGLISGTKIQKSLFLYKDKLQKIIMGSDSELSNLKTIDYNGLETYFMELESTFKHRPLRRENSDNIDIILHEFKTIREQLKETTVDEIERQKKAQAMLFEHLLEKCSNILTNFIISLQNEVIIISNELLVNDITIIPTESIIDPITCKGWLWGHNTYYAIYDQVNTSALQEQIENEIDTYAKLLNERWEKVFENACKTIAEKIILAISEYEGKIMSTSFDDKYYRDLTNYVLDELTSHKELKIGETIKKYQRYGADIANKQFVPQGTEDLEEKEVDYFLACALKKHNGNLVAEFRNLADNLNADVAKEVQKNLEALVQIIGKMVSDFSIRLKNEGEEYLSGLEKDMRNNKAVLEKINGIISHLSVLSNLH